MVSDQSPPLPLLITGIAGVAGYNAFHYFRQRYPGQVIGARRANNWPLGGEGIEPCDLHHYASLAALFDRYQFAAVLNCEGTCKLKSCELNPPLARRVNVQSVRNLLRLMGGTGARLVHLSVDLVFSGTAGGQHVEEDPPDPVTVYGQTMWDAERLILSECPDACIPAHIAPNGNQL